jgi:hypothetical protein
MGSAATSALRLHQRLSGTPFQLSRAYFQLLMVEDSFHYLIYSVIFLNSYPITSKLSTLIPNIQPVRTKELVFFRFRSCLGTGISIRFATRSLVYKLNGNHLVKQLPAY